MLPASVSEVVSQIKLLLEGEFRSINIMGEVSNLSHSHSGHSYFTISDKSSSLSSCLFRADAIRNPLIKKLKNGDKIVCAGSIGVYSKRGTFQLIAKRISFAGKGDLKEEFEQLKKRLAGDGLFDLEIKNKIPSFPKKIGVVTAENSAAFEDFVNIFSRRCIKMNILLSPALVQGNMAPQSIRNSLHNLIKYSMSAPAPDKLDVIVITRGGGSLEDLWAFNDEALAWDIYNCPIPVVSAVGHQVDFSISDFVADLRCETPSAAAEILTEQQNISRLKVKELGNILKKNSEYLVEKNKNRLSICHPKMLIQKMLQQVSEYRERLYLLDYKHKLNEFSRVHEGQYRLDECLANLQNIISSKFENRKARLVNSNSVLNALNPDNVLNRGYTYVKSQDKIITSIDQFFKLPSKGELTLTFKDGSAKVRKEV